MSFTRKTLAIVVALAIVLTSISIAVFAADEGTLTTYTNFSRYDSATSSWVSLQNGNAPTSGDVSEYAKPGDYIKADVYFTSTFLVGNLRLIMAFNDILSVDASRTTEPDAGSGVYSIDSPVGIKGTFKDGQAAANYLVSRGIVTPDATSGLKFYDIKTNMNNKIQQYSSTLAMTFYFVVSESVTSDDTAKFEVFPNSTMTPDKYDLPSEADMVTDDSFDGLLVKNLDDEYLTAADYNLTINGKDIYSESLAFNGLIKFDPQGGKWSDGSTEVKEEDGLYKEALNKVPEEPTYEHHNFEGWSTETADGTTSQKVDGVTYVGGKQSEILTDDEVKALTFEQDNDIKTLYAVWSVEQYTVKFVNYDNSVLQEGKWDYGSTPSYSGETPQKPATADKTFSYSGWSPDIAEVTADAVYTAQYTDETKTFTITFKNEDGTTLQTLENVPYGATPAYAGETPTKDADAQYTYTFDGWDNEIAEVTGDATYTATYSKTVNKYTATFVNYDGSELYKDENVEYGSVPAYVGDTPVKPSSDGTDYTFAGWDPDPATGITGDTTYTAQFNEVGQVFTITFKNEDGTVLQTLTNVAYGTTPAYTGDTPTKAPTADYTYTFDKWTPEIVAATENATYTATFTETYIPKQVKDTFSYIDSKDNSVIGEPIVKSGTEGETYEVPEVNIPEGYEKSRNVNYLDGILTWGSDGVFGSEDRNFSIPLDRKSYDITFVDENGEEISTEPVEYKGEIPEAPEVPEERTNEEGKVEIFKGWVASDGESQPGGKMPAHEVTFTPKYEEKKYDYTVTYYKDEDHKEVYSTSSIKAGDPITGPDNGDPQKFGYKFTGWQGTDGLKVGDTMPEKDIELTAQWELDKGLIAAAVGGAAIAGAAGTIAAANTALITGGAIVGGAALIGGGIYLSNNTHRVVYMVDGEVYRTFFVIDGTKVIVPSDPSKDGYTFAGWDNEIPDRMPNHDLTFNAKFVAGENADVPATGSATAGLSALAIISAATAAAYVISTRKKEEN